MMSQREEKLLTTGWKRAGRKRTSGDKVETTTASPIASDSPTEGTAAPHTIFQVQFQCKWDSWRGLGLMGFRLLNVHRQLKETQALVEPQLWFNLHLPEQRIQQTSPPRAGPHGTPSSWALQHLLLSLVLLLPSYNTQRTSLGCLDN